MDNDPIEEVTRIRSVNNELWMEILRIAYQHHPIRVREIIKDVRKNDKEVTKWLGEL